MIQHVRALIALARDLGYTYSSYKVTYNHPYLKFEGDPNGLFLLPKALDTYSVHRHMDRKKTPHLHTK